jgi:hypothetical protein
MQESRQFQTYMIGLPGSGFPMVLSLLVRGHSRWLVLFFSFCPLLVTAGCAAGYALEPRAPAHPAIDAPIRWFSPVTQKDLPLLEPWALPSRGPRFMRGPHQPTN